MWHYSLPQVESLFLLLGSHQWWHAIKVNYLLTCQEIRAIPCLSSSSSTLHPAPTGSPLHSSPTDLYGSHHTESNFSVTWNRNFRLEEKLCDCMCDLFPYSHRAPERGFPCNFCVSGKKKINQTQWGNQSRERKGYQVRVHVAVGVFPPCQVSGSSYSGQNIQVSDNDGLFHFICCSHDSKHLDFYGCYGLAQGSLWCLNAVNQMIGLKELGWK